MDWKLGVVSLIKQTTYILTGDWIQKSLSTTDQIKKNGNERGYKI